MKAVRAFTRDLPQLYSVNPNGLATGLLSMASSRGKMVSSGELLYLGLAATHTLFEPRDTS